MNVPVYFLSSFHSYIVFSLSFEMNIAQDNLSLDRRLSYNSMTNYNDMYDRKVHSTESPYICDGLYKFSFRKSSVISPLNPKKSSIKSKKSDAKVESESSDYRFRRTLTKSDLLLLKESSADMKQVQDPLSAPKLRNNSLDCPPNRNTVFKLSNPSLDYKDYCKASSIRVFDDVDSEEGDLARPSVLFPSLRLFFFKFIFNFLDF